jgi:hypothetical protein
MEVVREKWARQKAAQRARKKVVRDANGVLRVGVGGAVYVAPGQSVREEINAAVEADPGTKADKAEMDRKWGRS